jgi:tetraacyldisaccharide 4'-kinase
LNPTTFYDLISGRRRGALAALARGALRIAETPYAAAMRWRNAQYDSGRRLSTRVAVPVVCVGNLTLGGTGKTPFVAWLARWLRSRGVRVTLISRGYGAEQGGRNDEARELEQRLPDVPHLQNPNRVEAARTAIEECECQMILLDDGFQHRRLARDLDIVLLDALEPFGFGHVFPRGTLREPLAGLRRAQVVALSRADAVDAGERARIRETALRHAPAALWIEVAQRPRSLLNAAGARQPLEFLHGQRCAAFCGIGNPAGFRHTLAAAGAEVFALREFSDHHDYTREEIEALGRWAAEAAVQQILCTHKDLVKIGVTRLGELPLWAVEIGLEFLHGEDEFAALVGALLARIPPEPAEE